MQISPEKFTQFEELVFGKTSGPMGKNAAGSIQALLSWFVKVKSPTSLIALHISVKDIPKIAKNAVGLAKVWRMPEYTEEKIEDILKLCVCLGEVTYLLISIYLYRISRVKWNRPCEGGYFREFEERDAFQKSLLGT